MRIYFFLLLACSLLATGCTTEEKNITPGKSIKSVSAYRIEPQYFTPTTRFSGTILPQISATITAETMGTIANLLVKEGDVVSMGQALLSLSSGDSVAYVDVENAKQNFDNANILLSLTIKQGERAEKNALLAVEQAKKNLEYAEQTSSLSGVSTKAQKDSAKSALSLAQLQLENAKKSYENLLKQLHTTEANITETKINAISAALSTIRKTLTDADNILGVNPETQHKNNIFEGYLGFRKPQTKIDATQSFRTTWHMFTDIEKKYMRDNTSISPAELENMANKIRLFLQNFEIMLKQSVSGIGFPEDNLHEFQTQASINRNNVESVLSALSGTLQQEKMFLADKPQQIQNAQLAIEQAKKTVKQREYALTQTESGGSASLLDTKNRIANANNALLVAKSQLELTKKQNDIAKQKAYSEKNAAYHALQKAKIQAEKLYITSPFSGIVTDIYIDIGDTVSPGTPLIHLANIDTLSLKGEVPPNMFSALSIGDAAEIYIDGFPPQTGHISSLSPVANSVTHRIPIEISLKNDKHALPANIFATATLLLPTEEDVLLIPQNALISQNPPYVFFLSPKEKDIFLIEKREIQTGRRQGEMVEVKKGLTAGDIILPTRIVGIEAGDMVSATFHHSSQERNKR